VISFLIDAHRVVVEQSSFPDHRRVIYIGKQYGGCRYFLFFGVDQPRSGGCLVLDQLPVAVLARQRDYPVAGQTHRGDRTRPVLHQRVHGLAAVDRVTPRTLGSVPRLRDVPVVLAARLLASEAQVHAARYDDCRYTIRVYVYILVMLSASC